MAALIYVAEDDEGIRDLYECAFDGQGYEMRAFESAEEVLAALEERLPDLIILDIMLPNMDGITALRSIKQVSTYKNVPVLMVSARGEESVKVKGLTSGADDYITKPFGVMELTARINNILRRAKPAEEDGRYEYRDLVLDDKKHRVTVCGERLEFAPKEYGVLKLLLSRIGEVVEREEILDRIWGEGYGVETRTLDIHINGVRQKIAQITEEQYIKTVRSVGYMIGE